MDRILRESLSSMSEYTLIKSPESAVWPEEFLTFNTTYIQEIMKLITKKSISTEKTFFSIIKLILYRIHDKYAFKEDDKKFDFFDIAQAMDDIRDTDRENKRKG